MEIGQKLEFLYTVEEKDLAKYVAVDSQDNFPEVLATARMVALMEISAARLMNPLVQEEEQSVGVDVNVKHLAPTPVNAQVKLIATFTGMDSKLYKFDVEIHDEGGLAGKGSHTRAIIKTERLMQGISKRTNK
ncbi:MAG: hotdog domain-containing protein [Arcobacteraceae bacterium]